MRTIIEIYQEMMRQEDPERELLTVVDSQMRSTVYTLRELDEQSARAASALKAYGCEKGDRVLISVRAPRTVWAFFWGALKLGAVPCVLFPELGMGGLEVRLKTADANFIVTDADPMKLSDAVTLPESFKRGFLIGKSSSVLALPEYRQEDWQPFTESVRLSPDDDAFIVFTSGTTGTPKPVLHRHGIADAIVRSMREVLHASKDDVYWCTAHPAWITGTVYGILGPLLCGIPSVQYDGIFHAKRWMPILQDQKVTLWYTAPTALRGLMREDADFFKNYDFSLIKQIYSIGEPLAERVYEWGTRTFGRPILDTWFQTECGTIRIANQPDREVLPGWMGRPVDDTAIRITESGALMLESGFESMFKGYYGMSEATANKITGGYYETGDLAEMNADGLLRFAGRADDVINTSGHLVGPLEVEQVLNENLAIVSAAVVGEPDELLYEVPVAYVVLQKDIEWSRQLEMALKVAVNAAVSPHAVPKRFYQVDALPLTSSGKINRAALRATSSGNSPSRDGNM